MVNSSEGDFIFIFRGISGNNSVVKKIIVLICVPEACDSLVWKVCILERKVLSDDDV